MVPSILADLFRHGVSTVMPETTAHTYSGRLNVSLSTSALIYVFYTMNAIV